jgi:hypothetical protein
MSVYLDITTMLSSEITAVAMVDMIVIVIQIKIGYAQIASSVN